MWDCLETFNARSCHSELIFLVGIAVFITVQFVPQYCEIFLAIFIDGLIPSSYYDDEFVLL